jgi:hypothetical protein
LSAFGNSVDSLEYFVFLGWYTFSWEGEIVSVAELDVSEAKNMSFSLSEATLTLDMVLNDPRLFAVL